MSYRRLIILLFCSFFVLAGCEKYTFSFEGEAIIAMKQRKLPDLKPFGDQKSEEIALKFALEGMTTDNLSFDEFLWIETFVCGRRTEKLRLQSAIYLPAELTFRTVPKEQSSNQIVYAIYVTNDLTKLQDMADDQSSALCSRIVYRQPYELKKVSNTVKLSDAK